MDEQDLREVFQALQEQMKLAADEARLLGKTSEATEAALAALRKEAAANSTEFKKLVASVDAAEAAEKRSIAYRQALSQSASQTVGSLKSLNSSLAAGNTNFANFSSAIKSVTSTIGKLGSIIPGFQGLANGVGEAAGFVLSRADELAKSYNELSTVGAITARGVDGLRESFDRLGLVGLPEFTEAVRRNSIGLQALGSTTSRGATMVGKALGQLTDKDGPFAGPLLNLGYTIQEITSLGTDYAGMLALTGAKNIRTTEQLTTAMNEYLRQVDEAARATGRSREQIMQENLKNLADVRFRARIEELRARGQDGVADQLEELTRRYGGAMADVIRASVGGVPLTKEAQGATVLFAGAIQQAIQNIEAGGTATAEMGKIAAAGQTGLRNFNKVIQVGAAGAIGGEALVRQTYDVVKAYRDGIDPAELAKLESQRLAAAGGATESLTKAQIAVAGAGRELQRLGFDLLPAATWAVGKFADALTAATSVIRKLVGGGAMTEPRRGVTPGVNPGQAAQQAAGQDYLDMVKRIESGGQNIANQTGSSAFGMYQFMPKTYNNLAAKAAPGSPLYGTTFEDMKANPRLQEEAMLALTRENALNLARRGVNPSNSAKYMAHLLGVDRAANIIMAPESAPLDNFLKDAATIREQNRIPENVQTTGDFKRYIEGKTGSPGYRYGGVATGPRGGYLSVLHGTEAVVPLPDGRTIPVSMPTDITSGIREQVGLLSAQLSKMDEMIGAMRAQTAVSNKILQHSTS